jgi:hypothetical protein
MKWPQHAWLAGWIFWGSCIFALACSGWWGIENWDWLMATIKPIHIAWVAVALLATALIWQSRQSSSSSIASTSASSSPAVQTPATSVGAGLELLIRPNQDPKEISKDNVWRWFVFKTLGRDPKGKTILIGTYIFLVFDKPVPTAYRKAFSPNFPNTRFQIIEFTERSMVIFVDSADLDNATIEVKVSDKPV